MSNHLPKKIHRAVKKGDLIPYEEVFSNYLPKEREEILRRARYIKTAIQLRKLRHEMKISQEELAKKMQVKREFISRIESGNQNITLETLYRIGDIAGKEVHLVFK
ncbi:MAG: helix-turn-helix transcriptional regulator [Candidatus Portnoybacteria bacterium]|nr:helix-turn-helix transcriptional regulator [Candidatus Portnoybacteria bacterium]